MSEVKDLAIEVFEGRKKAEQRIKKGEVKKQILEDYIKDILDIFKTSNLSENSTVLVWQLKLCKKKEYDYLVPMISFETSDYAQFYNKTVLEGNALNHTIGDNEELLRKIENLKIPKELFNDLLVYLVNNLLEYLDTVKLDSEHIRIRLNGSEEE